MRLCLFIILLCVSFGLASAHQEEAAVVWDDIFDYYITCSPGQSVRTTWYLRMADAQPFHDAVAANDTSFWLGDQHGDTFFVPTHFDFHQGTNWAIVVYKAYTNTTGLAMRWAGVKYGDPNTDDLVRYRSECVNQAVDQQWVLQPAPPHP